jgi:alkaline phosphatase
MYASFRSSRIGAVLLLAIFLTLLNIQPLIADTAIYTGRPAKYIFLFIGDGMGQAQRMAAEQFSGRRLAMNHMPHQGITTTHAANRFITGSAAAATALASGQKTRIGMIGMDPERHRVKSIAEMAGEKGMKVGIATSVSIDHATPAAFYAHVASRRRYYDIALALSQSGFDFFGGGGLIDPANRENSAEEFKGDAMDLIRKAGYALVRNQTDFMKLKPGDGKVVATNRRLPDGKALPYAIDRQPGDIGLPEFTAKAIDLLDNPSGFFLMVEGGKIDWACHANDAATMIHDTLEFDRAVGLGIDFAQQHPRDTLVVVTGDHECGGLSLGWAGTGYESNFSVLQGQALSFQQFSDAVLPAFKADCGPDCDFDSVKPLISRCFGLRFDQAPGTDPMVPTAQQIDRLRAAFDRSMGRQPDAADDPAAGSIYGFYDPFTVAITRTVSNMAGLGWTSFAHTGIAVTTSAVGVGAEIFNGYYDNTDIAMKIMAVMGIGARVHRTSTPAMPRPDTIH